jgi:hypothetical protein
VLENPKIRIPDLPIFPGSEGAFLNERYPKKIHFLGMDGILIDMKNFND